MQSNKKKQDDRVFVMAVIKAYSKDGQNHKCQVKKISTNRKILSQGNMWNIKALALALTIQMLLRKFKFFIKSRPYSKVKVQVKKILVSMERL